jgi:hypothetical protein
VALKSTIGAIRAGLTAATGRGVKASAEQGLAIRTRLAPEDTGDLKRSGKVNQISATSYEFAEGAGLPDGRALFTEYGTVKQRAQPHMTPAAQQIDPAADVAAEVLQLMRKNGL